MKSTAIIFISLIFSVNSYTQNKYKLVLKDSLLLEAKSISGIDAFGNLYYIKHSNDFIKKSNNSTNEYSNFQLGDLHNADVFNPLKINLFYKEFNTVIILDNRLAEVFKIDLNTVQPYKNATHVSTGFDNTIWLFNQDFQRLELYDYKQELDKVKTVPIEGDILDLKSDYNYAYLLTNNHLYIYNYFGSLIKKVINTSYKTLALSKGFLFLKNETQIGFYSEESNTIIKLNSPNLLIKQFLTTNESLYLYDGKILREFQLKKD